MFEDEHGWLRLASWQQCLFFLIDTSKVELRGRHVEEICRLIRSSLFNLIEHMEYVIIVIIIIIIEK